MFGVDWNDLRAGNVEGREVAAKDALEAAVRSICPTMVELQPLAHPRGSVTARVPQTDPAAAQLLCRAPSTCSPASSITRSIDRAMKSCADGGGSAAR